MIQFTRSTAYRKAKPPEADDTGASEQAPRRATPAERQKEAEVRRESEKMATEEYQRRQQALTGQTARLREQRLTRDGIDPAALPAKEKALPALHKYKVGQRVTLVGRSLDGAYDEKCEISKLLPAETSDRADMQYRIKDIKTGRERIVKESQLAARAADAW